MDGDGGRRVRDHRAGATEATRGIRRRRDDDDRNDGRAVLADVELPDFGMPAAEPLLPPATYADRIERLRERMAARRYDWLVVWADREHSANIAYLTGFDPRFEEALLVVGPRMSRRSSSATRTSAWPDRRRSRCAACDSRTSAFPASPVTRRRRCPRSSPPKASPAGSRVGVVGWKTYASRATIEVPSFLVDELRRATGPSGLVENATDVLIDASDGLRVINEAEQLAAFEWAACQTSAGVRNLLTGLRPGMTEREAVRLLRVGRHATVVPPDAHRWSSGAVRAVEPGRPTDRAW